MRDGFKKIGCYPLHWSGLVPEGRPEDAPAGSVVDNGLTITNEGVFDFLARLSTMTDSSSSKLNDEQIRILDEFLSSLEID